MRQPQARPRLMCVSPPPACSASMAPSMLVLVCVMVVTGAGQNLFGPSVAADSGDLNPKLAPPVWQLLSAGVSGLVALLNALLPYHELYHDAPVEKDLQAA